MREFQEKLKRNGVSVEKIGSALSQTLWALDVFGGEAQLLIKAKDKRLPQGGLGAPSGESQRTGNLGLFSGKEV